MLDTPLTFVHISDTHIRSDPNYSQPYANYTPLEGTKHWWIVFADVPLYTLRHVFIKFVGATACLVRQ